MLEVLCGSMQMNMKLSSLRNLVGKLCNLFYVEIEW